MKFVTSNQVDQFYSRVKKKEIVEIHDLIRAIEEEFHISVRVEEHQDSDEFEEDEISNDPSVIRQLEGSLEDHKNGRLFGREEGLEFLRQLNREIFNG